MTVLREESAHMLLSGVDARHQAEADHDGRLDRGAGAQAVTSGVPRQYHAFQRDCGTTDVHAFKIAGSKRAEWRRSAVAKGAGKRPVADQRGYVRFDHEDGKRASADRQPANSRIAHPRHSRAPRFRLAQDIQRRRLPRAAGALQSSAQETCPPPRATQKASTLHPLEELPARTPLGEPNTQGNRGANVMVVSNVPHMAPSIATTTNCTSTTALTSLGLHVRHLP